MIKNGLRDGVPIALGYFSVAFSFGILAVGSGCSWWQALLISMANMTSAGQYAGLTVMAGAGTLIEMAFTQFVINLRYSLMSISLTQRVDDKFKGKYRAMLGFGITDEIFAVSMNTGKSIRRSYFFGLIIISYLGWAAGTLAGAICGNILPEAVSSALGIALFGMFVAIVVPEVKAHRSVAIVVIIAVILSCILRYVPIFSAVSSGFAIIICSIIAAGIGAVLFPASPEETEVE